MSAVDYVFTVTDQTSGTVTLTASPFAYNGGAGLTADRKTPTVGETLEVRLKDTSGSANLDELHTLNRLLQQAEDAQDDPTVAPVYLTWQLNGSAGVWRSEIISGRTEPRADALNYGYWTSNTMFAPVYLERANWWEGPEAQLPITNPNGTANTSGLDVYNCGDGSGAGTALFYNYFDVAGTAVDGDLPSPVRLEMTYNYSEAVPELSDIWIGQSWHNPTAFVYRYECEGAGGTATAEGIASNGTTAALSLLSQSSETDLLDWPIGSASLNAAAGMMVKPMLRGFITFPTAPQWRFSIYSGSAQIWNGPLVSVDTSTGYLIRDLGAFRLPPAPLAGGSLGTLTLRLSGMQTSGTAIGFELDDLHLLPLDGWRALYAMVLVPRTQRVVDDNLGRPSAYVDNGSGGARVAGVRGTGNPIMLKPKADQRLYFLLYGVTGETAAKGMYLTCKLYYRPRRLTL